ncbi:MAG TPA: NAD-dependent epimerase/dehydratase family protein [Chryseolinea sp.]|nr:NAD-dependent epimerase/dehydratase family protein [Chryseolinea sp.]
MIAVTGANGLLGSFIVRKLIQEQKSFIAIKRAGSDTSLLEDVADRIQWRTADVLNPLMLSDALEGCTEVIHSAAVVSFNPWQADNVLEINSIGTRNIVNACFHQNIKRLVHISSVAALGRQKEQTIIREDNKWVENPLNSVYADSKYKAELEVFRGQEEGLNTVILNPSVILAPADWNRSSAKLFRYVWHQRPFYIDASLNYVDVRDVASCAYQLLQSNFEAERFIVSAGNISFKNFFEKTANKFDVKPPSVRLSKSIVKSVARFERIRTWFTRSEPLITRETAQLVGAQFLYDNKKIKNNLNFEFQTLDNTLEWCCDYYNRKFNSKK